MWLGSQMKNILPSQNCNHEPRLFSSMRQTIRVQDRFPFKFSGDRESRSRAVLKPYNHFSFHISFRPQTMIKTVLLPIFSILPTTNHMSWNVIKSGQNRENTAKAVMNFCFANFFNLLRPIIIFSRFVDLLIFIQSKQVILWKNKERYKNAVSHQTQSTAESRSWWCPKGLFILSGSLFRYSTNTWTPCEPNSS